MRKSGDAGTEVTQVAGEYGGDHIDISGSRFHGNVTGKHEEHHHYYPRTAPSSGPPLGTPLSDLSPADAHILEVHEAVVPADSPGLPVLPPYLHRPDVDDPLRASVHRALEGSSVAMVVGPSSTGKTRACWEAIRNTLPAEWRLWHPLSPSRPQALVEGIRDGRVVPHTVVWLNEAQLYLGDRGTAEALQDLLRDPARGPVLVLGSMWPEYWSRLTSRETAPDTTRMLLQQADDVVVQESFTPAEIRANSTLFDSDPRLHWAINEGQEGRITQALSGARELVRRYQHGSPVERAVLKAAMDAHRLDTTCDPWVRESFLRKAPLGYLTEEERRKLHRGWFDEVIAKLCAGSQGTPGPLYKNRGQNTYTVTDYLRQYGTRSRRALCPPDSFWSAVTEEAARRDSHTCYAEAAADRFRLRQASGLYRALADSAPPLARFSPDPREEAALLSCEAGDLAGAGELAFDIAWYGRPDMLLSLTAGAERDGARTFVRRALLLLGDLTPPDELAEYLCPWLDGASPRRRGELVDLLQEVSGPQATKRLAYLRGLQGDWEGFDLCQKRLVPRVTKEALLEARSRLQQRWSQEEQEALTAARNGNHKPWVSVAVGRLLPEHPTAFLAMAQRALEAGMDVLLLEWLGRVEPPEGHTELLAPSPAYDGLLEIAERSRDERVRHVLPLARALSQGVPSRKPSFILRGRLEMSYGRNELAGRRLRALSMAGRLEEAEGIALPTTDASHLPNAVPLLLRQGAWNRAEEEVFRYVSTIRQPRLGSTLNVVDEAQAQDFTPGLRLLVHRHLRSGDTTGAERILRRALDTLELAPEKTVSPIEAQSGRYQRTLSALALRDGRVSESVRWLCESDYLFHHSGAEMARILLTRLGDGPSSVPGSLDLDAVLSSCSPQARLLVDLLAWCAATSGAHTLARTLAPQLRTRHVRDLANYPHETGRSAAPRADATVHTCTELADLWMSQRAPELDPRIAQALSQSLDRSSDDLVDEFTRSRQDDIHRAEILAWVACSHQLHGDQETANELYACAGELGGVQAAPELVSSHLESGNHDSVRDLCATVGRTLLDFQRSLHSGEQATVARSVVFHTGQPGITAADIITRLAREDALELAAPLVREGARTPERAPNGSALRLDLLGSPVTELLNAGEAEAAERTGLWLRHHGIFQDYESEIDHLEWQGDWDSADLLRRLSTQDRSGTDPVLEPDALRSRMWRAEESGDPEEAERVALLAADSGQGMVLRELAERRITSGVDTERWRSIFRHGVRTDGTPSQPWAEETPLPKAPRISKNALNKTTRTARHKAVSRLWEPDVVPLTYSALPLLPAAIATLLPLFLASYWETAASGWEFVGLAGLVITLLLWPGLSRDLRERWPVPSLSASIGVYGALWGPAMVAVRTDALSRRATPVPTVLALLCAPFSIIGFVAFSGLRPGLGMPLAICVVATGMIGVAVLTYWWNRTQHRLFHEATHAWRRSLPSRRSPASWWMPELEGLLGRRGDQTRAGRLSRGPR